MKLIIAATLLLSTLASVTSIASVVECSLNSTNWTKPKTVWANGADLTGTDQLIGSAEGYTFKYQISHGGTNYLPGIFILVTNDASVLPVISTYAVIGHRAQISVNAQAAILTALCKLDN